MRRLSLVAVGVAAALPFTLGVLRAQQPGPDLRAVAARPEFDVASLKPNRSGMPGYSVSTTVL